MERQKPTKLNDSVYEFYRAENYELEVVAFHGLCFCTYENAYITTWQDKERRCWLRDFIAGKCPESRILSVSYDSCAKVSDEAGRMSFSNLGRILVQDLIHLAEVGQRGCPVVLIGYCLGGLVIEQLCIEAEKQYDTAPDSASKGRLDEFLTNVRSVLYLDTPHTGSTLGDYLGEKHQCEGPVLEYLSKYSSSLKSLGREFDSLVFERQWDRFICWYCHATEVWDSVTISAPGLEVVTESSARRDAKHFRIIEADHSGKAVSTAWSQLVGVWGNLQERMETIRKRTELSSYISPDKSSETVKQKASQEEPNEKRNSPNKASETVKQKASRKEPNEIRESDELYVMHEPDNDSNVELELIFFPGTADDHAYKSTWMSKDGKHCWLQTWLPEAFPRARILAVSLLAGDSREFDLQLSCEILIDDITFYHQRVAWCPLILVGHGKGGLVIKELCNRVQEKWLWTERMQAQAFLRSVRGFAYYGTSHVGYDSEDPLGGISSWAVRRLNYAFNLFITRYGCKELALGETRPTKLGSRNSFIVDEYSASYGKQRNSFIPVAADHISICKPESPLSNNFLYLKHFIHTTMQEVMKGKKPQFDEAFDSIYSRQRWEDITPRLDVASKSRSHEAESTQQIEQISDHLYKLYEPTPPDTASLDIFFFHGLEYEDPDAYISSWRSTGGKVEVWPQKWLPKDFPKARIFSVQYDMFGRTLETEGRDLSLVGENVLQEIVWVHESDPLIRPVILVGHGLGGLVIKAICVFAEERIARSVTGRDTSMFLENIRGIFFYNTPHRGMDTEVSLPTGMSLLNAHSALLHEEFHQLWKERWYSWNIFGLGATQWAPWVLVPEASSRFGDHYIAVPADHVSICRPSDRSSLKYLHLKRLIEDVQRRVEMERMQCLIVPEVTVGVDALVSEVLEKHLRDHSFVGFVGTGGVGKTTLATLIFNKVCAKFEFTCFMEEISQEGTREEVRRKVWQKMRRHGVPVSSELTGEHWNLVTGKSLFIVFDDVQDKEHVLLLKEIVDSNEMEESRFVLTSRSPSSLLDCGMDVYILDLSPLSDQDARKLFTAHAFPGQEEPPKFLEKIVDQVLLACEGLPLSLVALGKHLRGKDIEVWNQVPTALRHSEDIASLEDRLKLRLSYDTLPGDEVKHMFLDIASFFIFSRGKIPFSADDAVMAWSSMYGSADSRLESLVDRSLVTVSYHEDELMHFNREFSMHKQIRSLGQRIAELEGRTFNLSLLRRFAASSSAPEAEDQDSYPSDDQVVFQEGQELGGIVAHRVKISRNSMRVSGQTCLSCLMREVWPKLTVIRYMELEISISDCCERCRNRAVALPSSLVLLRLIGNGDDLSGTLSLTTCDSLVKLEVWQCTNLGELSQLQLLRILKISHSSAVGHWESSLGKLRSLERLELSYITKPFALPTALGALTELQHLRITYCRVTSIPDSFRNLTNLRYLEVDEIVGRQSIPNVIGSFRRLRSLKMTCWAIEGLMESFGELISLESLNLRCGGITELPDTLGKLTSLRGLSLTSPVEFLPDTIGYLTNLEHLTLKYPLQSLPASFSNLKLLKSVDVCLQLHGGHGLSAEVLRNFIHLESLKIVLEGQEALADILGLLRRLRTLTLKCYAAQNCLAESFRDLCSLEVLELRCERVEQLPSEFGCYSNLRTLKIHCPSLQALPGSFGMFVALSSLHINETRLRSLPDSFGQLSQLQDLTIAKCKYLLTLPETLGYLSSLLCLQLSSCESLQSLPETVWQLPRLRSLSLDRLKNLKSIPEGLGNLHSLRNLVVSCCSFKSLPESLGQLSNLRRLDVEMSENLEMLPEAIGELSSLKSLSVLGSGLKSLPYALGNLSQLETLDIRWCKNLTVSSDLLVDLPSLKILHT